MHAITVDRVVKRFGDVEALKGVSLRIEQGELFFLLGGSGCGKTTLLRCIAGLEEPTEGEILFGEETVTRLPAHKREAAMVFQSYALWPHLTVRQNIAFGLEERGVGRKEVARRVEEALEMVKLPGYGTRTIDQMSGGQQQRVSLARALVVRPRCLLLDEPLSNLDAQLRLEMRTEIRRIVKENNLTAVYVTHDQAEALSVADRMAVMDRGEVVQTGSPQEIYRMPRTRYVAEFIGETNLVPATVLNVEDERLEVDALGQRFASLRPGDAEGVEVGQEGWISLRPEAFSLGSREGKDAGERVGLRATVREATYLGQLLHYEVETEGGACLQVAEVNPRRVREAGSVVELSFDWRDGVMVFS